MLCVLCSQTLIKIITGEHKSSSGTVWRHPNLRMAYVAQHAFHHLEEHLDTTPLKYMFKRFGLGTDQVRHAALTRHIRDGRNSIWVLSVASQGPAVCSDCLCQLPVHVCGPALTKLLAPPSSPPPPPCHPRLTLQEDSHKVDRQAEDDEKKKMAEAYWMFDGHPRKFREILSRRKKKKGEGRADTAAGNSRHCS